MHPLEQEQKEDFKKAMNLQANQNIIFELNKRVKNGRCEDFWRQYTDDILEYI